MEELEAEMRKICKEKLKLERFELPREEAIKYMEEKNEPYKVELINDLPLDAHISFYTQGEFTDLCAGPHLDSHRPHQGQRHQADRTAPRAYWRGDVQPPDAPAHLRRGLPEERAARRVSRTASKRRKKRDHRKLGKELGPVHAD